MTPSLPPPPPLHPTPLPLTDPHWWCLVSHYEHPMNTCKELKGWEGMKFPWLLSTDGKEVSWEWKGSVRSCINALHFTRMCCIFLRRRTVIFNGSDKRWAKKDMYFAPARWRQNVLRKKNSFCACILHRHRHRYLHADNSNIYKICSGYWEEKRNGSRTICESWQQYYVIPVCRQKWFTELFTVTGFVPPKGDVTGTGSTLLHSMLFVNWPLLFQRYNATKSFMSYCINKF